MDAARVPATSTVEAFATRLRDEIDPDTVVADCVTVVRRTVEPAGVFLWIRPR